jgi:hypothetical protein
MAFTAKDVEFLKAMTGDQLGWILTKALHELYRRKEHSAERCALAIAIIVVTKGINESTVAEFTEHGGALANLMKQATAA